jgi:hypothetical protein
MYVNYPTDTRVTVSTSDNTSAKFDLDFATKNVPPEIDAWLNGLGWGLACNHPDTLEALYQKSGNAVVGTGYFTWNEAVAWEWYMMMSLGGND